MPRVTAIYNDSQHKRYAAQGDWLVITRTGDLIEYRRFRTEGEARIFAADVELTACTAGPLPGHGVSGAVPATPGQNVTPGPKKTTRKREPK